jgi:hypothetical protein
MCKLEYIKEGNVFKSAGHPIHKHGIKRKSSLWTLKYWLVSMFDIKTIHRQ